MTLEFTRTEHGSKHWAKVRARSGTLPILEVRVYLHAAELRWACETWQGVELFASREAAEASAREHALRELRRLRNELDEMVLTLEAM